MEADKNIHSGHRDRMRARFDEVGFKGWSDHEILEYMLYGILPRRNTNPIAHRLLNSSGNSIVKLLKNSEDNMEFLTSIRDVNDKTVIYLRSLKAFIEYYRDRQIHDTRIVLTDDNVIDFIRTIEFPDNKEDMVALCLTGNMQLKCIARVTDMSGSDFATADIDKLVRVAARSGTDNMILVHNHPSGAGKVSPEDVNTTLRVQNILDAYGIYLIDHFIVCDNEVISIKMARAEEFIKV